MSNKISPYVLQKLKQWEGLRLKSYRDSGGVLTIGYGHTGQDVKQGATITEEEAEAILRADLARFEGAVSTSVRVPLNENQFGALVSFAFNVGVTAFKNSTLLRKLNAGDYDAVPGELARWSKVTVNGKKVVLNGLVNRRAAEAGLWATGSFVSSAPVHADISRAKLVSPENVAVAGSVISSVAMASAGAGPLQWAFAGILVIAAITAAVIAVKRALE